MASTDSTAIAFFDPLLGAEPGDAVTYSTDTVRLTYGVTTDVAIGDGNSE